jgi:hypothetical protein
MSGAVRDHDAITKPMLHPPLTELNWFIAKKE